MKKNQKKYTKELRNGMVASLYITERYWSKAFTVTDKDDSITTMYYEEIGAIVGRTRRQCNDWYNGDKTGNKLYNKMTGANAEGFLAIISMMNTHIDKFISAYGYYCCMIDGTDDKRMKTYIKAVFHYCNKKHISLKTVATDDGLLCWME
jgi:hypothetical protein